MLGHLSGMDYLTYIFEKLRFFDSPFSNDSVVYASIREHQFTKVIGSQRFSFLDHFQIIASIGELIKSASSD